MGKAETKFLSLKQPRKKNPIISHKMLPNVYVECPLSAACCSVDQPCLDASKQQAPSVKTPVKMHNNNDDTTSEDSYYAEDNEGHVEKKSTIQELLPSKEPSPSTSKKA